jgi:hypothetical protein
MLRLLRPAALRPALAHFFAVVLVLGMLCWLQPADAGWFWNQSMTVSKV